MPFSEIVGHEPQLATLARGLEQNRLHHAWLFLGPEGVGKRTVALSLAMAIQCLEKTGDSCGGCSPCAQVRSGHHPDVRVIEPSPGKKEISIQQVRDLERELSFRPFSGRKKVAIIDPATLMNTAAQNALLKTLEEPPGDSLLILISTSIGGLLPTVLSRCLRLSFAPLPEKQVMEFLVSHKGLKRDEAAIMAALTMGSLGKALQPDIEELFARRKRWTEGICSLGQGDYKDAMALAEALGGTLEESVQFLNWLTQWYRDVLVHSVTGTTEGTCNVDRKREIEDQAKRYGPSRSLALYSEAVRTAARIPRNVNRRMALENLFAHIVGAD